MNDEELADAWTTLEPTVGRRRRIDAQRVGVARGARHAARGRVARTVQGCAVRSARSCHGERGLDRRSDTARLVRACADVNAENDSRLPTLLQGRDVPPLGTLPHGFRHSKFAASSMLPLPLYIAICG